MVRAVFQPRVSCRVARVIAQRLVPTARHCFVSLLRRLPYTYKRIQEPTHEMTLDVSALWCNVMTRNARLTTLQASGHTSAQKWIKKVRAITLFLTQPRT